MFLFVSLIIFGAFCCCLFSRCFFMFLVNVCFSPLSTFFGVVGVLFTGFVSVAILAQAFFAS